ncbi:alpha 1,2 mannosyltransferase [Onygenales sp. PD_12]|nr:alpha 1,2 mannosyltransferase [Onygenales sp. PD_12]
MWRRSSLLLLLVRVYFALAPSYLHPDEHFQGPEIVAGQIFSFPSNPTWEFTSEHPIRSVFPLWLIYGLPMTLLKWLWAEAGSGSIPPSLVYYVLRLAMFVLSFVLEDWAIHELVSSPRHRKLAVVLVASSYVTWTYQTHTFSNSIETLLVAWSLVLMQRIYENKHRSGILESIVLSFLIVTGVFNRITFPAFILIPGLQLVPHFLRRPLSLVALLTFGLLSTFIAITIDTNFYNPSATTLTTTLHTPTITPLNNLLYNTNTANLSTHGLHPRYQHFLINLPQLLGPVFILLLRSLLNPSTSTFSLSNMRATSALSATALLSIFPHQEPRFLLPCVPLLLTCFRPPRSRLFLASWLIFNTALGLLMGIYHQGGVVPTQLHIPTLLANSTASASVPTTRTATVFWWKTYSPPNWLLGDLAMGTEAEGLLYSNISTVDLMGIPGQEMIGRLEGAIAVPRCGKGYQQQPQDRGEIGKKKIITNDNLHPTLLVAPMANLFLDQYVIDASGEDDQPTQPVGENGKEKESGKIELYPLWSYRRHLNLDDLDFGEDGLWATVARVVGRRGLGVWLVGRGC